MHCDSTLKGLIWGSNNGTLLPNEHGLYISLFHLFIKDTLSYMLSLKIQCTLAFMHTVTRLCLLALLVVVY